MSKICFFDDEEILNEHELAWMSKDMETIKKLADSFKEKPESELFSILNHINIDKVDLNVDQFEGYSKYMIDSMLSQHIDCLYASYTSNMLFGGLSNQAHYNYMINIIPKGRRFSKGIKLDDSFKDTYIIRILMEYYKVNNAVAQDYRKLLERKGKLDEVLKNAKFLATDDFLKSITKNPKEIKELKLL